MYCTLCLYRYTLSLKTLLPTIVVPFCDHLTLGAGEGSKFTEINKEKLCRLSASINQLQNISGGHTKALESK